MERKNEKLIAGMYVSGGEIKGVRTVKAAVYGDGLVFGIEVSEGLELQVTVSDILEMVRTAHKETKKVSRHG